jgi:hypothetical protein
MVSYTPEGLANLNSQFFYDLAPAIGLTCKKHAPKHDFNFSLAAICLDNPILFADIEKIFQAKAKEAIEELESIGVSENKQKANILSLLKPKYAVN